LMLPPARNLRTDTAHSPSEFVSALLTQIRSCYKVSVVT
jgi:hypothetical protein